MLSGTVRAMLMSCVTIRNVASICGLRSMISCLRYAVRTGSRPESGSSNRMISRVEHQGAGQPGPLAHAAGDLAGQLPLGAHQADHVHLLHDDGADLGLRLAGVLAQREGDVVVEVHRAEQRAVLEQHAEQLADLVEGALGAGACPGRRSGCGRGRA